MGEELLILGESTSPTFPKEKPSIAELLDMACPQYMAIGVTYDQYWDGEVDNLSHFRKAHRLKMKMENEAAWRNSLYLYQILLDVYPLYNPNVQKEVHLTNDLPLPLTDEDAKANAELRAKRRYENMLAKAKAEYKGGG